MEKIGLVSCVSKKRAGQHKAADLYISTLFVLSRTYVEKNYDKWFVLSAKHHLLGPSQVIESYNKTLNNRSAKENKVWAKETFRQIAAHIKREDSTLFIHAGMSYRKYLVPLLRQAGYKIEIPLAGLRIGEQLSWYKKRINHAH